MLLNALVEKLKRRSKHDFKGRHFEATLILQAVSWYLRYPLSYRDIEELFLERGLAVDHSTLNRWVLAYAPLIERRLRSFRKPHCGSIRIDETYIKIRGQWRYLYRAIDKHGTPVDFLLTAKRDLDAAKRFFRKMLQDERRLRMFEDLVREVGEIVCSSAGGGVVIGERAAKPLGWFGTLRVTVAAAVTYRHFTRACRKVFSRTICDGVALCRTCIDVTIGRN